MVTHLRRMIMTLKLMTGESTKSINQTITFVIIHTTIGTSYIHLFTYSHPIRLHLVKESYPFGN